MPFDDIGQHYYTNLQQANADAYAAVISLDGVTAKMKPGDTKKLAAAKRKLIEVMRTTDALSTKYDPDGGAE